ncbi:MAG: exopolysaccharide biosynthesis protein [Armatimonadota bacterium]
MVTARQAGEGEQELPLSAVIEAVLDEAKTRPISLGDLVDRTADRGFGLLLLVLGLPMLIPILPPGASTIVGPIYAAFAVQMLSGSTRPWIPRRLRDRVLEPGTVKALRERGVPLIRRAERFSRPRGVWLSEKVVLRLVGIMVFLMGLVLLSPLPFLNTLPAISVMLIGMGMLNRDAVFMGAGAVVGGISLGLIGFSAGLVLALFERLRSMFR